ncbi:MAG: pentapeptide repeat-containing protein [Calothrix sp. FI2-JRJ7]|jgi:uncharacterized protein YjbI with pentapeptide repeats|nr:pentapeptide repeat-containing protein [Calothrix sp. FI2-JRJ7]
MINQSASTNQPKIVIQSQQNNQDVELQAQSLVLEYYLARMNKLLLKEICYSERCTKRGCSESNRTVIEFILQDTVNVLRQLQGNHHFQNAVITSLRSFDICTEFNEEITFHYLKLKNINFDAMEFSDASFKFCDLENASFKSSFVENCYFNHANISNVNFEDAFLDGSCFQNAKIHNTNFKNANLEGVDICGVDLSGAINLCVPQVKEAKNWKFAYYNPEFQAELDNYVDEDDMDENDIDEDIDDDISSDNDRFNPPIEEQITSIFNPRKG